MIRLSYRKVIFQNICECTLVRNHTNAINVIKAFTIHNNFRHHLKRHTEEKPYQRTQCDETISQKQTFTKHIRTHSGEKPYQCNLCDKGFTQKSDLTTIREHTSEKPYQSNHCDKAFPEKLNLTKHKNTH